ncbi:hypothetical protein FDC62_13475 [Clostridium botulinum]|uniref:hypothetical protein n=1 Tax=Clostridium botulinum TaxID=1491 RepID=UPI0009926457|nr:hypothetical protein [Clostridium botulinum]NFO99167.1 hypothetical protein [Clostridium botulinum]OOV53049.1 hypothetical protein B1A66_00470 [Clostridium botulinum D/C]OOV58383.1 hypothetical protein B0673_02800 [Clostridium botulinum D/C]OOV59556.1 hypothetical protein B1A67_00515 [Clostridium botulinum D/C]
MCKLFKEIKRFIYLNRLLSSHTKFISTMCKLNKEEVLPLDIQKHILKESAEISDKLSRLYATIEYNYKQQLK